MNLDDLPRRRLPLPLAVAVDLVREVRHAGTWAVLLLALGIIVVLVIGTTGQAAVPFLVYGGL